jgi:hypothetical protein
MARDSDPLVGSMILSDSRDDPFEHASGHLFRYGEHTEALRLDTIGSLAYSHAQWLPMRDTVNRFALTNHGDIRACV